MTSAEFEAISPGLPSHQDEVMAAHTGSPSIAQQSASHGAGVPAEDRGMSEQAKYGTAPA